MKVTTIGIDLAKNVFQIHGVNELGKATLRKQLKRAQVAEFFATLAPGVIGMEACGSAHHWARKLQSFGHTVGRWRWPEATEFCSGWGGDVAVGNVKMSAF